MSKRFFVGCLISLFVFSVLPLTFAQNEYVQEEPEKENLVTVKGAITEIAEDGSYIIVDDGVDKTKFLTTKEFLDEEYLEVGDKLQVTGERTANGIKLVDYNYDYDDDTSSYEYKEEESDSENISFDDYNVDSFNPEDE